MKTREEKRRARVSRSALFLLFLTAACLALSTMTRSAALPDSVCSTDRRPAVEKLAETTEVQTETAIESASFYIMECEITHYCPCSKCCGKWADGFTATGTRATAGRTAAVDPDVIPYGSTLTVFYEDGRLGQFVAEDCGGGIRGNHIDLFMESHKDAIKAGRVVAQVMVTLPEVPE